jgi:hypothetical protein
LGELPLGVCLVQLTLGARCVVMNMASLFWDIGTMLILFAVNLERTY